MARESVDQRLAASQWPNALNELSQLWRSEPTWPTASYLLATYDRFRDRYPLPRYRVRILRSFTVEPIVPLLQAGALAGGIDLAVEVGGFNTYAQELLDGESDVYRSSPDAVVLAVQTRDLVPELWYGTGDQGAAPARAVELYERLIESLRSRTNASMVLQTFDIPPVAAAGVLDSQAVQGQLAAIHGLNGELRRLATRHRGIYVSDYESVVARHGREQWYDERRWLATRLPMTGTALLKLADEWLRFFHPLSGVVCKALACDLDGVLWGGVIGEDGLSGIQLGEDYPGAAYLAVQRAIRDLYERGIILAICSKNNPVDAMQALEQHPAMLLRPQHFATMRMNWNDKAANLRDIAAELNIGTDAIAFLDDNPVERAQVRSSLPEVTTIELPDQPMRFATVLRELPHFERLTLSSEDRSRGRHYAEQRERTKAREEAPSIDDFYATLEQVVELQPFDGSRVARAAQLTQKTNQFNTTTERYTEARLLAMSADPKYEIILVQVRDRFGDSGLVGSAALRCEPEVAEIESLLLSCRVIGRKVETAMLSELASVARARGCGTLRGWIRPTKKNTPSLDVYERHGFVIAERRGSDTLWSLELGESEVSVPEWMTVQHLPMAKRA